MMHINQIIMSCTLNLDSTIHQLYLNKTWRKQFFNKLKNNHFDFYPLQAYFIKKHYSSKI